MNITMIDFCPGNGYTYVVEVAYIAQNAIGDDGLCAFCHGDPCGEKPGATMIRKYYFDCAATGLLKPDTCPMCQGRPS